MKSGIYKQYKTVPAAERNGVPLRFEPNSDKSVPTFVVARMGGGNSKKFQAVYAEVMAPHAAERDLGILSEELRTETSIQVFVGACLRGWAAVQDEEGNTIEFTPENALKLFKELPELFDQLHTAATLFSTYRAANLEATAKN